MTHSIEEIQTKRGGLLHHLMEAYKYADKKDFPNVRHMLAKAEQEMVYLEREDSPARDSNGIMEEVG